MSSSRHNTGIKSQQHHPRLYTLLHKLNAAEVPPLAPITGDLERSWRTHGSYYKGGRVAGELDRYEDDKDNRPDLQRMEFIGDSILCLAVTILIDEMHYALTVGERTVIRDLLVANSTLCFLSVVYKLPDRLLAAPNVGHSLARSPNVQADLFEAYCGAMLQYGTKHTIAWLRAVFQPLMEAAYQDRREIYRETLRRDGIDPDSADQQEQPPDYVSLLSIWANKERRIVAYEKMPGSDLSGLIRIDGKVEARLRGEEGFDKWMGVKSRLARIILDDWKIDLEPLRLLSAPRTEEDKAAFNSARNLAKTEAWRAKKNAKTLAAMERISFILLDDSSLEPIPSTTNANTYENMDSHAEDDDAWLGWVLVNFASTEGPPAAKVQESFVEEGEWVYLTMVPYPKKEPFVYKPREREAKRAKKGKGKQVEQDEEGEMGSVADLEGLEESQIERQLPASTKALILEQAPSLPSTCSPPISIDENPLKRKVRHEAWICHGPRLTCFYLSPSIS